MNLEKIFVAIFKTKGNVTFVKPEKIMIMQLEQHTNIQNICSCLMWIEAA